MYLRGVIESACGNIDQAVATLLEGAETSGDPSLTFQMLHEAAEGTVDTGDLVTLREIGARAARPEPRHSRISSRRPPAGHRGTPGRFAGVRGRSAGYAAGPGDRGQAAYGLPVIFTLLGAAPGDILDDLFPASGTVSRAWAAYTGQSAPGVLDEASVHAGVSHVGQIGRPVVHTGVLRVV
jgi:hypothetical protein